MDSEGGKQLCVCAPPPSTLDTPEGKVWVCRHCGAEWRHNIRDANGHLAATWRRLSR